MTFDEADLGMHALMGSVHYLTTCLVYFIFVWD